jgi:hypothetical protein
MSGNVRQYQIGEREAHVGVEHTNMITICFSITMTRFQDRNDPKRMEYNLRPSERLIRSNSYTQVRFFSFPIA